MTDAVTAGERRRTWTEIARPLAGPAVLVAMIALFAPNYGGRYFQDQPRRQRPRCRRLRRDRRRRPNGRDGGRRVDLSVSGLASLAAVSAGVLLATTTLSREPTDPANVAVAVALGLAIGVAGGLANGLLVARLGVMAFIATLATSLVFSNLAAFRVDGKPVYNLVEPRFVAVARGSMLGIPNRVLFAAAIGLAIWFLLDMTPLGRRMYAVGGNAKAARYSGIDVRRAKVIAFAICGLAAAMAGILRCQQRHGQPPGRRRGCCSRSPWSSSGCRCSATDCPTCPARCSAW